MVVRCSRLFSLLSLALVGLPTPRTELMEPLKTYEKRFFLRYETHRRGRVRREVAALCSGSRRKSYRLGVDC